MSFRDVLAPEADGWRGHPAVAATPAGVVGSLTGGHDTEEVQPPTYRVSSYTVYPSGFDRISHPHRGRWCVTVADAGDGWAIRRGNMNLNIQREWEFEPPADVRDDAFLRRCRFNEHAALLRARRVIDKLTVHGITYEEFVQQVHEETADLARQQLQKERGVSMLKRILDWHAAGKPKLRSTVGLPVRYDEDEPSVDADDSGPSAPSVEAGS